MSNTYVIIPLLKKYNIEDVFQIIQKEVAADDYSDFIMKDSVVKFCGMYDFHLSYRKCCCSKCINKPLVYIRPVYV